MDKTVLESYQPTIGIECHVQLNTQTKLFARVSNDAKDAEPNTTVSAICFGLPGVLPYLNSEATNLAIRAGHALNAKINESSKFDRKHYFYPDLPKGYQITQYDRPIIGEGYVEVPVNGELTRVEIERAHLEEDAGKLAHPDNADYSLVDLNRAGTPLLEIVSKPVIKSPAQAKAYARELYLLMMYSNVSDTDLYQGHMRFDVNISVAKKESTELGTRAEVKNLNSFKAVEKAAQYEFERQVELLEKGQQVTQETRGWHDDKQKTFSQRGKEEAHDYRYFPEPDLPPLKLSSKDIASEKKNLPAMPKDIRRSLTTLNLDSSVVELIIEDPTNAHALQESDDSQPKEMVEFVAKIISGPLQSMKNRGINTKLITFERMKEVFDLSSGDKISSSGVDQLLLILAKEDGGAEELAQKHQLIQKSDESELSLIIETVIQDNQSAVEDYKRGEQKVMGFLVGQVMSKSQGQANPKIAQKLLAEKLSE